MNLDPLPSARREPLEDLRVGRRPARAGLGERTRRPRGVSLVEVLVAYGILVVAVLALLGLVPAAARQHSDSDDATQALYLAEEKMEQLLQLEQRIPTVPQSDYPLGDLSLNRQWWGSAVPQESEVQMVHVLVTWVDEGRPRRVFLQSYLLP